MRKLSLATIGLIGAASLAALPAQAALVPLLSVVNPPGQSNHAYEFSFTATGATTTLSFGGYQTFAYEYVSNISVMSSGGSNLLQTTWSFTPAAKGSNANLLSGGSELWFGGRQKEFDTFSQSFATTPGTEYFLKFDFTNNALTQAGPGYNVSAIRVAANAMAGRPIPEASTWLMMLMGFGGLGVAAYRRKLAPRSHPRR